MLAAQTIKLQARTLAEDRGIRCVVLDYEARPERGRGGWTGLVPPGDTGVVPSVYKSRRGQVTVRQWCSGSLARAGFLLTRATVDTSAGPVALVSAGDGERRVVVVPGTGYCAAAVLPWLEALSARWAVTVADLPGQPGLSDPRRPWRGRLAWYGRVLDEVLEAAGLDEVVLAGNSLGAAVALAADSPRIAARALISPAGIVRLSVDPVLALASARWLLRPAPGSTRSLLRLFTAPGEEPPGAEVAWMTLVAASCRTTLAPPPLPAGMLARRAARPCVAGTGEHDRFLPPQRLAPALRQAMGLDLRVLPGMGHLTTPGHLGDVVSLVAEAARQAG